MGVSLPGIFYSNLSFKSFHTFTLFNCQPISGLVIPLTAKSWTLSEPNLDLIRRKGIDRLEKAGQRLEKAGEKLEKAGGFSNN